MMRLADYEVSLLLLLLLFWHLYNDILGRYPGLEFVLLDNFKDSFSQVCTIKRGKIEVAMAKTQ